MSTAKHTPGPWKVIPDPGASCDECGAQHSESLMVASANRSEVGIAVILADDCEIANANLIAAAPELLEACKREYASTVCYCFALRRASTSDKDDTVCDRCKLEALIAKAEGRTA